MNTWKYRTTRTKWRSLSMQHDQAAVYRQFSDADMCTYFDEPPCTLADAQDIITHYTANPSNISFARYAICHDSNDTFIGTCGYHFYRPMEQSVEIGYDIWKAFWRQGYARELLPQLLDICFALPDVSLVYAVIFPENIASIRTVCGNGFVQIDPPPRLQQTTYAVYGLTRDAFYSTTSESGS